MKETTPRYLEVVNWITKQIHSGEWKAGDKIPSELALAKQFGLSRQTIRHALSVLIDGGILESMRGSGTYIKSNETANDPEKSTIVIMMTYIDGYIFPRTIRGIENALFNSGYSVQLAFTNNRIDRERVILEDILKRNDVAGVIAECTKSALPNPDIGLYERIMEKKIPLLFINSFYEGIKAPHVSMNDTKAGYVATNYLLEMGHTKLAGMFKLDDGQGRRRYTGFVEAIKEKNLPWRDDSIIWYDTEDSKQLSLIKDKILTRLKGCTGLVCYNDEMAFELLKILSDADILVPGDLSIVSIDDSDLAILGDVMLTSVPHPMEDLGKIAAENMLKMIEHSMFDGNYEFDVRVVERESVRRIIF